MDEAEDFLNEVGPQVMAEVEAERRPPSSSRGGSASSAAGSPEHRTGLGD